MVPDSVDFIDEFTTGSSVVVALISSETTAKDSIYNIVLYSLNNEYRLHMLASNNSMIKLTRSQY